ncbi:MAG TPA: DUF4175 family protein [Caulobacteraceae bacterium]|jgi:hypothetical protein|nr:DUF4175 family protein [Caulobacteraceae bacterium]
MSDALDTASRRRLNRALRAGWRVMLWERAAVVWAPFLIATFALIAAACWGAFTPLTTRAQLGVLGAAFLIALVFAVHGGLKIRLPKRTETTRRVERDSGFEHAPVSLLADRPAVGDHALWALQVKRAAEAVRTLRVGPARAGLAAADPFALRYALLVVAALAVWARGPDTVRTALLDFRPTAIAVALGHRVADASQIAVKTWVTRPRR